VLIWSFGFEIWDLRVKRVLLLLLFFASFCVAHEDLSDQIKIVTAKIKLNPRDPSLYFERAELFRGDSQWAPAEKDYLYTRKLSPELKSVDLGLGLLYYDTKRWKESLQELSRFLKEKPDHAVARITRGRVLKILGDFPGAIEDYSVALKIQPDPAVYIERARWLAAENKVEEALTGLNDGISKLGPVITMELYAIELEISVKRYESALDRLNKITAQSERKELWLVRRAEILHLAARNEEAKAAYGQALEAIQKLPEGRRNTRYTKELQKKIELALEQFVTNPLQ
jgi:tetratricopeptide (TPR) repeat protein